MPVPCDHRWQIVATFEGRGSQLRECSTCGETKTTWLVDAYLVPSDPMDELGCDSCQ